MSYATLQDLVDRAGEDEILETADRDTDGTADPEVIAAALATADEEINVRLAVRYVVPLSTVPPIVLGWAVSIARYVLHRHVPPDNVVRDYNNALAALEKAGAGKLALPDLTGNQPTQSPAGATLAEGSEPVFTRANLEGFL